MTKTCITCGGSWLGKPFDTTCVHDFDEAPEPERVDEIQVGRQPKSAPLSAMRYERVFRAVSWIGGRVLSTEHPTREGAIAAWKAAWRDRREVERARESIRKIADHGRGIAYPDGTVLAVSISGPRTDAYDFAARAARAAAVPCEHLAPKNMMHGMTSDLRELIRAGALEPVARRIASLSAAGYEVRDVGGRPEVWKAR